MNIAVVAPLAEDRFHDLRTGATWVRRGGPGLWIEAELQRLGAQVTAVRPEKPAAVDIDVDDTGEHGRNVAYEPIILSSRVQVDAAIVSTVADEFDLVQLNLLPSVVALDVQGYVRAARMVGEPVVIPDTPQLAIVKATVEELAYLDSAWVEQQKSRILLVTRGSDGCDVYDGGACFHQPAIKVDVSSTVGAGDVFLASFLVEWLGSSSAVSAAAFAARRASEFLTREYGNQRAEKNLRT